MHKLIDSTSLPCAAGFITSLLLSASIVTTLPASGQTTPAGSGSGTSSNPDDVFCMVTGEALKYLPPSSRSMAGLLEKLARAADARKNQFLNRQRAELLKADIDNTPAGKSTLGTRGDYAVELLNSGQTQAAISEFQRVLGLSVDDTSARGLRFQTSLRQYEALGYLRLGEEENCLTNHTSLSCILPIKPGGVHRLQQGSRKAIAILEEQLTKFPRDRKGIWLLNVAYMTLGEYPDKVPANWRIPPSVFQSDYDIKTFPDIAGNLGLDVNDYAGGTVVEDLDGDGYLDIMTSDWSLRGPMHFFHNQGDGNFVDRTMEAGLTGLVGGLSIVQGDYNNDGLPDILVLRGAWLGEEGLLPDSLLRNDGNGHFTDVTEQAGLITFAPNQAAAWLDFDGDGWLDIYFGYESFGDRRYPCKLYHNNRDGTFTECAEATGAAAIGFVKGVVSADFNNDGRPDLYLSCRGQPNILLRNDGPRPGSSKPETGWQFTDVAAAAGVTEPIASFPTFFFDYDNDGWDDLMVTGYAIKDAGDVLADLVGASTSAERARLYHNNRDGTFTDVTKEAHLFHVILAMGANFGDFDNDGWLDMYFGTGDPGFATLVPNKAYRNAGGKFFQDVTTSGGFGHLQKGHGVSFGDLNNDGTQDIYHSVGGAYEGDFYRNVLFENPGHGNHWVTLKLEGVRSNKVALGARVHVLLETAEGDRSIHRTVSSGGSFGANPFRMEIGLGQAKRIKQVEILWPTTGRRQVVKNLEMDSFYRIVEEDPVAKKLPLRSFKFAPGPFKGNQHLHTSAK